MIGKKFSRKTIITAASISVTFVIVLTLWPFLLEKKAKIWYNTPQIMKTY